MFKVITFNKIYKSKKKKNKKFSSRFQYFSVLLDKMRILYYYFYLFILTS